MLEIRRASLCDLDKITDIISSAREYLAEQNIDQWQDFFPSPDIIADDIENKEAYVIVSGDNTCAYFAFFAPPEPAYKVIYGGKWLVDTENYAAMHHIAISKKYRGLGLAHIIYAKCEELARNAHYASLRVDTHEDNRIMRHCAEKNGFVYCGTIYYNETTKRLAFEKRLI